MSAATRSSAKWSVGDWCYWDYELSQVKQVEPNGQVMELSTGVIRGGASDNRAWMVPLTLENKVIADSIKETERRIRSEGRGIGLNWLDLHRKLVELWLDYVDRFEAKDSEPWRPLQEFEREVIDQLQDRRMVQVGGVRLFGR